MDNPAPAANPPESGGSAGSRGSTASAVRTVPPSPGTILVGEQAQLAKLKDDMTQMLGSRLNKRSGLQREHYEHFQRALCGVSTDADFGSFGAAWRGPWSTDIQAEVVAQIRRLQHSTGFRHFKTPSLPVSAVAFETVFEDNTHAPQRSAAPSLKPTEAESTTKATSVTPTALSSGTTCRRRITSLQ
eukprot:SAG11_NODE_8510_length_1007_cov_7.807269_1_plen_186_part_01